MSSQPRHTSTASQDMVRDLTLGVIGGVVGACLGYVFFHLIARQGFYAIALPGAFMGLGCGSLSGRKSFALGIVCAIGSTIAGILTEWRFAPFITNSSLSYFLSHLHQLKPLTLLMIVTGSVLAFWFGMGRQVVVWPRNRVGSPGQ